MAAIRSRWGSESLDVDKRTMWKKWKKGKGGGRKNVELFKYC